MLAIADLDLIALILVVAAVVAAAVWAWVSEAEQPKARSGRYGIEEDSAGIDTGDDGS